MSDRGEKKAGAPAAAAAPETAESLDKVRDILFGSQMRTVERRLGQLEERLLRELAGVRAELERQVGAVEAAARKGSAALDERLKGEQAKRADEVKALRAELRRLGEQFAADLQGAVAELRTEKTDTASLVEVLTEMAQRLSGDLTDPTGG